MSSALETNFRPDLREVVKTGRYWYIAVVVIVVVVVVVVVVEVVVVVVYQSQ